MSYTSYLKGKAQANQDLRNKYVATKTCPEALKNRDELQFVVADLQKKAINSDYWRGYADAHTQRLGDVRAYYNFGDCDNYFNRYKVDKLGKIVDKKNTKAQDLINAETKKQNRLVLFVGLAVMLVGTLIILKRK